MNIHQIARSAAAWGFVMCWSSSAIAQVTGSGIAGVARDTSGGVLPGVSVEISSPALIEQVRTAVTDGQGAYQFVDIRPGVYIVTFTLPGFSTFRREGLELSAGFTATVNAEMRVGALEETITVSGQAPVVDTHDVRSSATVSQATLSSIPGTGRLSQMVAILPAAQLGNATLQNVGGVSDRTQTQWSMHGAPGAGIVMDGADQSVVGGGQATYIFNNLTFQEVVVEMSGMSAERSTGGVQMNVVPRDGGNTFSGVFTTAHATNHLESDNMTDELQLERGLKPTPSTKTIYDTGGGVGGPIVRNRLWFYGAFRTALNQQYQQGNFYNRVQGSFFYEADETRQAYSNDRTQDYSLRITWQAAERHKLVFADSVQPNCNCAFNILNPGTLRAPEAAGQHHYNPNGLPSVSWSFPATNRLLIEAGQSANIFTNTGKRQPETGTVIMPITDTGLDRVYGSRGDQLGNNGGSYTQFKRRQFNTRFAVSYVTGSHAFKSGFDMRQYRLLAPKGGYRDPNQINQARDYTFQSGVPRSVRIWAIPHGVQEGARDLAFFVQDQWTVRRLSMNLGVRYNDFRAWTPAQSLPEGPWVPARSYEPTDNVPHWRNLTPRFGAAYDLFGTGRTALKFALGRYAPGLAGATSNPPLNQAHSTSRNWNDLTFPVGDPRRGNFVPDCDLLNPEINGECQAWSDRSFGKERVTNSHNAEDANEGFNLQSYNWQGSVSVQHELWPNIGINVGYFRTWYGNFLATDNLFWEPSDFDHYCITAPTDPALPVSGELLCGLYDIKPDKFDLTNNEVTQASHFGDRTQIYNGVDFTLSARFGRGGQFSGGFSIGRTTDDNCVVVDSPQAAREGYCKTAPTLGGSTQAKFLAVYPLPWGVRTSIVYQDVPGIQRTASYVASNAEIATSLGRNLGSCRGATTCNATVTLELLPANTYYEDRLRQVDLRFSKVFAFGRMRVTGNFDINNLFNASDVLNLVTRWANNGTWLDARQILGGRLAKMGVQVDF
jgi:hypothetical protein